VKGLRIINIGLSIVCGKFFFMFLIGNEDVFSSF
jgi:hypothetical protein